MPNILNVFQEMYDRLNLLASAKKGNESEIIRWCIDFIKNALGYEDQDIETELKVLGQRVDIAVKKNNKVLMVIECKSANVGLTPAFRNQVARYAVNLTTEWAVLTNGQIWKLYHIKPRPGEEPDCTEVFDIFLLDEEGFSEYEADCLYLLTPYSIESGEIAVNAYYCACISEKRLFPAMFSERVINAICEELEENYKKETGVEVSIDKEDIEEFVNGIFGEL